MNLTIGILKESKNPPDLRVAFTPEQCSRIEKRFPGTKILVQQSNIRAFSDEEYMDKGLQVKKDISEADVFFGVKEVEISELIPNKCYFFFSHTIKKQSYNRELLRAILQKNIQLVDYECLKDQNGIRLVGFGRYAGIVGAYNAFLAYGERTGKYHLKPANSCRDKKDMEAEFSKIKLPKDYKIILSGTGRVGKGAMEVLQQLNLKKVDSKDFLNHKFDQAVFAQLSVLDYLRKKDAESFEESEFYEHPEDFESDFYQYAKVADMFIAGHYWDSKSPVFFTREEVQSTDFKIRTIADISCDIAGPIPSTIRPSTIEDPIYSYDPKLHKESQEVNDDLITVMAVDNLPCELPRDASEDFGSELIEKVLPNLLVEDREGIIERATIAEGGKLKTLYDYLHDYIS